MNVDLAIFVAEKRDGDNLTQTVLGRLARVLLTKKRCCRNICCWQSLETASRVDITDPVKTVLNELYTKDEADEEEYGIGAKNKGKGNVLTP